MATCSSDKVPNEHLGGVIYPVDVVNDQQDRLQLCDRQQHLGNSIVEGNRRVPRSTADIVIDGNPVV
jgi:hypothetical protein